MRISHEVQAYARERGLDGDTALREGMREKAAQFRDEGGRIYLPVHQSGT